MRILDRGGVEDFKIKTLAKELGTTSMAVYNYFDSRDALLEAVADRVCGLFRAPPKKPGDDWPDTLRAWLWALKEHAEKYPVMPLVVGFNGHTSAGWLKVTVPVTLLFYEELGLRDKQLAQATYIFVSGAITMINMVARSSEYRSAKIKVPLDDMGLSEEQKQVVRTLPIDALEDDAIFASVFEQLIDGAGKYAQGLRS